MDLIGNSHLVTEIFGEWPSFHDAEVHRVTLDRSGPHGPTLEASIHVFNVTDEVTAKGHYRLTNHTLITLLFSGVALEVIRHFNHQNVIEGLRVTVLPPREEGASRLAVSMPGIYGMDAEFECTSCEVQRVEPLPT